MYPIRKRSDQLIEETLAGLHLLRADASILRDLILELRFILGTTQDEEINDTLDDDEPTT